jgi:hypothetical protein
MIGLSRTTGSVGAEIVLMLMAQDRTNPNPAKDLACYKQGDVVEVLPPTAHDGNLIANPIAAPWWLIRVVGIPRGVAMKYQGEERDAQEAMTRRRAFGVTFADLPAATRAALTADRYAVIQWGVLRLAVRNKATNLVEAA